MIVAGTLRRMAEFKKQNRIAAFSLVEISIVLIIIGILTAGALKGFSFIDDSRATAITADFQRYALNIFQYQDRYGAIPGDDPNANRFAGVSNGAGSGNLAFSDQPRVWAHLHAAKLADQPTPPTTRWGGQLSLVKHSFDGESANHYLVISAQGGNALLTTEQAMRLKSKIDPQITDTNKGRLIVTDGNDVRGCVRGNEIDLNVSGKRCIAYFKLD